MISQHWIGCFLIKIASAHKKFHE